MNLTSKRMLQFLSVCAGAVALTASATDWVSDNFEAEGAGFTNAAVNSPASTYKSFVSPNWGSWANLLWEATPGDVSTIQYVEGNPTALNSPIVAGTTQLQALKLETEGQTLWRNVNFTSEEDIDTGLGRLTPAPLSFASSEIYVDTLMRFTPSEDEPEITDDQIRAAFWVNSESNLVIRHNYIDVGIPNYDGSRNSVITSKIIDPNQWYRLTIKLAYSEESAVGYFSVILDGETLTHSEGFAFNENGMPSRPNSSCSLFSVVAGESCHNFSSISFQGTGWVDDLVVTDSEPSFTGGPTVFSLTLVFDDTIASVMAGGASISSNGTVAAGSALTITAADWYTVASVTSDANEFAYTGALGQKKSSGTASATGAGTLNISTAPYTGSWATGKPGDTQINDISDFAAWARGNGQITEAQITEAGVAACMDQYLLNIAAADDATIKISDIQVNPDGTVTIEVRAVSENVNFTTIRGKAIVYTSDDLAGQWGDWEVDLEIAPTQPKVMITMPEAAGKFIKAKIIQLPAVTP